MRQHNPLEHQAPLTQQHCNVSQKTAVLFLSVGDSEVIISLLSYCDTTITFTDLKMLLPNLDEIYLSSSD
jgi:hypothetical protein